MNGRPAWEHPFFASPAMRSWWHPPQPAPAFLNPHHANAGHLPPSCGAPLPPASYNHCTPRRLFHHPPTIPAITPTPHSSHPYPPAHPHNRTAYYPRCINDNACTLPNQYAANASNGNDANQCKVNPKSTPPQQFKDPLFYMKFNPCGAYCIICLTGFVARHWKSHFNNHHPELVFSKQANGFVAKLNTYILSARDDPQRWKYATSGTIHVQPYCISCKQIFASKKNFNRHNKNGRCTPGSGRFTPCYALICGSYYPITGTIQSPGMLLQDEREHFELTCSTS